MKVFLSYTLRDGEIKESQLREIELFCLKLNVSLFIDKLHNFDANPQYRIEQEIKASDILILMCTSNIFKSEWVQKEILIARSMNLPIKMTKPKNALSTIKSVYNKCYE